MRTCVTTCDVCCKGEASSPMPNDLSSMLQDNPTQPQGWTRFAVVTSEMVVPPDKDALVEAANSFQGTVASDYMDAMIKEHVVPFNTTFDVCSECLSAVLGPLHAVLQQRLKERTDLPPLLPTIAPLPFRRSPSPDELAEGEE